MVVNYESHIEMRSELLQKQRGCGHFPFGLDLMHVTTESEIRNKIKRRLSGTIQNVLCQFYNQFNLKDDPILPRFTAVPN